MKLSLVPSLPAAHWSELESLLESLKGITVGFQVDIVDGNFVSSVSWPFTTAAATEELERLRSYTDTYELELDCMVAKPQQYLDTIATLGAKRIIVHYGSTTDWQSVFEHQAAHGYLLGLGFTNDVSLERIEALLPHFDYVQVMGIAVVGTQGQPFDERTLATVTTLRAAHPDLEIAIDGSVNAQTIPKLKAAGANRFAPGSAIAKAADPVAAYKQLHTLL